MKIVLASASPRRKELLGEIVEEFVVEPSNVDEGSIYSDPLLMTEEIAVKKAKDIVGDIVLGADTVVFFNGIVLGKPKNRIDAIKTLKMLSGKWHEVATGVALKVQNQMLSFVDVSKVKFKALSEKEIEDYVDKFQPFDKAGSYGIQDGVVVEKFEGSWSNIVGLPLEKLQNCFQKIEKEQNIKLLKVKKDV